MRELQVRQLSSLSRSYSGQETDLQEVARQLKVRAVLTGKVIQREDDFTISIQLVDAQDQSVIMSEQYDRKRAEMLVVQEVIARQICAKLRLRLTGEEAKRRDKHYTENAEAFDLYLKGRYCQNQRTEDGLLNSIRYFEEAIAKDSNYALAYAGLADSYSYLGNHGFRRPHDVSPKAKINAETALKIDDTLAEAHTALAYVRMNYDWDPAGAEISFQQAIALNPKYTKARSLYAWFLTAHGALMKLLQK